MRVVEREGAAVAVGAATVTPIERVGLVEGLGPRGAGAFGEKRAVGVVVVTPRGRFAFDLDGRPLDERPLSRGAGSARP